MGRISKINNILKSVIITAAAANEISKNSEMKTQSRELLENNNGNIVYKADKNKRKKLLKIYINDYKKTMPEKHKWVFAFYIISIVWFLAVIISSVACLIFIKDGFDRIFISFMSIFTGLLTNVIPYSAYKANLVVAAYGELHYRDYETVILTDYGFDYYFYDKRNNLLNGVALFKYSIDYGNIEYVLYDERVKELLIVGVKSYQYIDNNEWKSMSFTGVEMQETYQFNIIEQLQKNNVLIKKMDYLVEREETKKRIEELLKQDNQ